MKSYRHTDQTENRSPETSEPTGIPSEHSTAPEDAAVGALLDPKIDWPLSIQDVCTYTGLSRTLIAGKIKAGSLPARKAGRRTLVMRSDLTRWLLSLPEIRPTAPRGEQS